MLQRCGDASLCPVSPSLCSFDRELDFETAIDICAAADNRERAGTPPQLFPGSNVVVLLRLSDLCVVSMVGSSSLPESSVKLCIDGSGFSDKTVCNGSKALPAVACSGLSKDNMSKALPGVACTKVLPVVACRGLSEDIF